MSIKLEIGWTDSNVIIEGVRIYKSSALFDVGSRPAVYVEILDGSDLYEDFNVVEGQTYFYMLSCFLSDQEVFTECFEVKAEKPSPYNGIYIISSTADNVTKSLLSEMLTSIGQPVYVKNWADISSIPSDAKIIVMPHLDSTNSEYSVGVRNTIVSKFNSGIPLLIMGYTGTTTFTQTLGIATSFADSSGNSIDMVANTVLGSPYNTAQSNLVVRASSYYMSAMNGVSPNAKLIAMKGSIPVAGILQQGAMNKNSVPSPANIAFAGFGWTRTGQLLSENGKDLLREIVKKTMR